MPGSTRPRLASFSASTSEGERRPSCSSAPGCSITRATAPTVLCADGPSTCFGRTGGGDFGPSPATGSLPKGRWEISAPERSRSTPSTSYSETHDRDRDREMSTPHPADGGLAIRRSWTDCAVVGLLPLGGVVLSVLGWCVGVFLLWRSAVWTVPEKLAGTLLWPGGYLTVGYVLGISARRHGLSISRQRAAPRGARHRGTRGVRPRPVCRRRVPRDPPRTAHIRDGRDLRRRGDLGRRSSFNAHLVRVDPWNYTFENGWRWDGR